MSDVASFAGYPVLEPPAPCPDGDAFASRHPLDGRPVVVRRLTTVPGGDGFVARGRAAQAVSHPQLARLVDVGEADGVPFAVLEVPPGVTLTALLAGIGPMPADVAARFAAQLAGALAAAHAVGLTHGGVSADRVVIGPLEPVPDSPHHRPAAGATATLLDLGLLPTGTVADDLRGLGETAYRMLAGHDSPLAVLRPDAPPELRAVVDELRSADPADRPSAAAAADRFVPPAVVELTAPPASRASRQSLVLWVAVGAALNLLGIGLFVYALSR